MATTIGRRTATGGVVRELRPADTDRLVDWLENRQDGSISEAWFSWKYLEPEWVEEPLVAIAENGRELTGFVGFVPLPDPGTRGEGGWVLPGDVMVDAEAARSRSSLFEAGLTLAANRGYTRAMDLPDPRRAFPTDDWHEMSRHEPLLRVQHPSAVFASVPAGALDRLTRAGVEAMTALRRTVDTYRRSVSPVPVDIVRLDGAEPDPLLDGPAPTSPADRSFARYTRWRYAHPHASYRTYVAYRHGSPIALAVTERLERDGLDSATIVARSSRADREDTHTGMVLSMLLHAAADHVDADLVTLMGSSLPRGPLERLGFLGMGEFPLSLGYRSPRIRMRTLGDDDPRLPVEEGSPRVRLPDAGIV